ncbi:hypothetical protein [Quadrisphaera sp. KR29]|uniref:hypothetical protein n=1 Tax=Quadrisphaera sp. KR29 TaxID=3461391 RepID=UPI0040441FCA
MTDHRGDGGRDGDGAAAGSGGGGEDVGHRHPVPRRSGPALRAATLRAPAAVVADRLCRAAVALTDVDGAVLTALHGPTLLVPVGASGPLAAAAEEAESTAGEGPALDAHLDDRDALFADLHDPEDGGRRLWPAAAVLVARSTPYRSVVAVPVPVPDPSSPSSARSLPVEPLVLSCYRRAPLASSSTPIGEAVAASGAALAAAHELAADLGAVLGGLTGDEGRPGWLSSRRARQRAQVWRAQELLVRADPLLERGSALGALRMFAVVHGVPVERVAAGLLTGRLQAEDVRGLRLGG